MFKAKENGDKGVFGCKMITPDDLEKFEEVDRYFVDCSGWGQESEPAMTPEQFLTKVKKDKFYAVIDYGQFQLWVGEYIKIGEE